MSGGWAVIRGRYRGPFCSLDLEIQTLVGIDLSWVSLSQDRVRNCKTWGTERDHVGSQPDAYVWVTPFLPLLISI